MAKAKHPGGRPSKYNIETAKKLCDLISTTTKSIRTVCEENDDLFSCAAAFRYLGEHEEFRELYARAKDIQVNANIEKMQKMIDENYHYDTQDTRRIDSAIFRAQIDAIKWKVGKLQPKRWGKNIKLTIKTLHFLKPH